MVPDRAEVIKTLRNTHLFARLGDDRLGEIADALEVTTLRDGETLFREGANADSFYIILTGKMAVTRRERSGLEKRLATLVAGDYFGEEALLTHAPRTASISALADSTLLRLDQETFDQLVHTTQNLKQNLMVAVESRRLARQMTFTWLSSSEVIYFIARRHQLFLILRLILPVGIVIGSLLAFILLYFSAIDLWMPALCSGLALAGGALWAGWNYLDWSNDFYIVTNQRVTWLEKIALIYDSRQEAPLSTVLSVGVQTSQFGRIFGYGNVNVRTFTGNIVFAQVHSPEQVAALVEEQWFRAKSSSRREENQAMAASIRRRLGLEMAQAAPPLPPPAPPPTRVMYKPSPFARIFSHLFTMRFEEGDNVTYRKHWFILIQQSWVPGLLILLILTGMFFRILNLYSFLSLSAVLLFGLLALFPLGLWFLYELVDWQNDIYQVTPEQILDIDKTPLGREEKKAAPLENILSIQYERLGIIGLLFNFGTVYITVGGTKFTFDYVFNPSGVQQDVFRRMGERIMRKKRQDVEAERERVTDWFASFYDVTRSAQPNSLYGAFPFLQPGSENLDQGIQPGFIPPDHSEDDDMSGYGEPGDFPPAPEF